MSEVAWAAGFFDGEGSLRVHNGGNSRRPFLSISVSQVDRRPLDRFAAIVGGKVYGPYDRKAGNNANARPCYDLVANGKRAWPILCTLWTYLSDPKREQALRAIRDLHSARGG